MKVSKNQNFRAVMYLCYLPRSHTSIKNLEKNAFYKKRTTNHWPNKSELVNEKPNTYAKVMPEILEPPEPELQEIGERLTGLY